MRLFMALTGFTFLASTAMSVPFFMEKSTPTTPEQPQENPLQVIQHENSTSASSPNSNENFLLPSDVTPTITISPEVYLENHIYSKAVEGFQNMPRTRHVLMGLAKSQVGNNQEKEAIRTLQPLLNEYLPEARILHGNILLNLAETAYAKKDLKTAEKYIYLYEKDYAEDKRAPHTGLKRYHRIAEQLGIIKRTPVKKGWFWGDDATVDPETAADQKEFFRVGVLLPLSGPTAQVGQDILRGMQLGLFDQNKKDDNYIMTLLYPQDTEGTPEGAIAATRRALKLGADIIVGPLSANNAEAANKLANREDVPLLSFSSTAAVATPNLHLLGYTPQEQARAAARKAVEEGRYNVAALIPSTEYGYEVLAAFTDELQKFNIKLQNTAFYNPQNPDIKTALTSLLKLEEARENLQKEKNKLEALHEELGGIMPEEDFQRLKFLRKAKPEATVDFDALFIPATTTGVRLITSQMATYDADKADILYLGTASWNVNALKTIKAEYISNGLFFAPSEDKPFLDAFKHAYKTQPHPLAQLGYDAVKIAQNIAIEVHHGNFTPEETLTRPEGFSTLSGPVKFMSSGQTQRLYDIYTINNKGLQKTPQPLTFFPPIYGLYDHSKKENNILQQGIQMPSFENTNRFLPFSGN